MSLQKASRQIALLFVLCLSCAALAQSPAPTAKPKPILPEAFAGWVRGPVQSGTDAKAIDASDRGALKEYGFVNYEVADYKKDDRTLKIRAMRFADATGSYGAFTFYRSPDMKPELISMGAVSANERVLFFRDNILVNAVFDHVTAMSASELRQLAGLLPGMDSKLPDLPGYLPRENMVTHAGKFVTGPAAYETLGIPLPVQMVGFDQDAELMDGKYRIDNANADLVLIKYPTPAIAISRLHAIESMNPKPSAIFEAARTGPIVAVAFGAVSQSDAKRLVSIVNYEANVTWSEPTGLSKRDNIGTLVVAALALAFIIFVISVGTGTIVAFGRAGLSKLFPKTFPPHSEETDFIRLDLK